MKLNKIILILLLIIFGTHAGVGAAHCAALYHAQQRLLAKGGLIIRPYIRAVCDFFVTPAYAASKGVDPVAHWKFDEGGGSTAYDETANNNDGTLNAGAGGSNTATGQMWTRQGKIGGALECDGTDDYVNTSITGFSSTVGTIEVWVSKNNWQESTPAYADFRHIVSNNRDGDNFYWLGYRNSTIYFDYQALGVWQAQVNYSTASWSANTWHHLTAVYQANNYKLYVDGKLVSTDTSGSTYTLDSTFRIGRGSWGATLVKSLDGLIDDVLVYNYERSADQILVDYNAGSAAHLGAGTDPNEGNAPVGYWTMDENTGTSALDRSGNGNNVTLTGAAWTAGKYGSGLSFNGTSSTYGNIIDNNNFTFTGDFTLEGWVKTTSTGGEIIGNYGTSQTNFWTIEVASAKASFLYNGSTRLNSNTSINDSSWHHVAGVRSGSALYVYVDGKLDGSATGQPTATINPNLDTKIGNHNDLNFGLNGLIDDVRIYAYARTAAQIAYDYSRGAPVAHYRFDDASGTIAHNDYSTADTGTAPVGWWRMDNSWADASGNGNNGTAGNGATFSSSAKIGPYSGSFDGVDDYAGFGTGGGVLDLSTFSIECWAYLTRNKVYQGIVAKGTGGNEVVYNYLLWVQNQDVWLSVKGISSGGLDARTIFPAACTLSLNTWYHMAVTVDNVSKKAYLYINGTQYTSRTFTGESVVTTPSDPLQIGSYGSGAWQWGGYIDDVRIYNYARTPEQIYNDYKTTHGTLVGDTKFVDGKIGKGLTFDGAGDYVNCGTDSVSSITGPITLSAWVNFSSVPSSCLVSGIMSRANDTAGNGYFLGYGPSCSDTFSFRINNTAVYAPSMAVSNATWYHVVGVYDETQMKIYINGVLKNSTNYSGGIAIPADALIIGAGKWAANPGTLFYWPGKIDDVRIYNYARSADQILVDYNAGSARLGAQAAGVADPWGGALPVGWWTLDENTGVRAYDASVNGNNGTLTNGPTWTQGKNGSALSFDGNNDYVSLTYTGLPSGNQQFTMVGWFKTTTQKDQTIVGIGNNADSQYVHLSLRSTGQVRYGIHTHDLDYSPPSVYNDGNWHYMAMVYNGTKFIGYYDGKYLCELAYSPLNINLQGANIGYTYYASSWYFNGSLDDVRIYNYARSPAQIAWDYNRGKPIAHWRMDEATSGSAVGSNTVKDDSGNSYHGTGSGHVAWTTGKFGGGLTFDGTDDYVQSGAINTTITEKTLMAWVKLANLDQQAGGVVGIQRDPAVTDTFDSIVYGEQIARRWMAGSTGFTRTFNSDAGTEETSLGWVHMAITYKANDYKLYRNGVLIGSSTAYGLASYTADSRIYAGKRHGTITGPLNAQIDDVRIYNYARTADQIQQDYLNGASARLGD